MSARACLAVAVVLTLIAGQFVGRVSAEIYQNVNVLVAYDEEMQSTAGWRYGYTAEFFCKLILEYVSNLFKEQFSIKFTKIYYASWDSDDNNIYEPDQRLQECIDEVGFYSGMTYNTIPIDVLVGFTDQEMYLPDGTAVYGVASRVLGAVLATEEYYYFDLGQTTDNVLQHELTHLYSWADDLVPGLECTMNVYPIHHWAYGYLPSGFFTEAWCNGCSQTVLNNKTMWGRPQVVGGGPYPPLPESVGGADED